MAIISISSPRSGGKDTVGKIIQMLTATPSLGNEEGKPAVIDIIKSLNNNVLYYDWQYSWQIRKFADKLKEVASILTGIPKEDFEKEEIKNSYLPECWNKWTVVKNNNPKVSANSIFFNSEITAMLQAGTLNELNLPNGFKYVENKIPITVRQFLQWLGTDAIRDGLHENTWVNALMSEYKPTHILSKVDKYFGKDVLLRKTGRKYIYKPYFWKNENIIQDGYIDEQGEHSICHYSHEHDLVYPNWIITDTRFPNELQAIKDRDGICIRIDREAVETGDTHESERAWRNWNFDYVIDNNGSIEDLITNVEKFLKHVGIIP